MRRQVDLPLMSSNNNTSKSPESNSTKSTTSLMIIALRYALCSMRASLLSVGIGKIKSQDRFRFDGRQPTNVDLTALPFIFMK